ncbi:MAG TPA: NPCBM/NEW2 domain-containing protein, partial [Gemmataceae bacterium]|nr:NPCBM/NEW2 domain-containing protein [Gemmataceae bacterium]
PVGGPSKEAYTAVELTDGSVLRCSKFLVKGKEATVTLSAGPQFTVPLTAIASVLHEANNEALVRQFREYVARAKKQRADFLLVKKGDSLNGLAGTVGDGNETGDSVEFTRDETKRPIDLAKTQGLVFFRETDPNMVPAVCKLLDTARNEIQVASVARSEKGFVVATPAGAKIEFPRAQVARLDYSKGKLTFLSDMDPSEVVEKYNFGQDSVQHYRRDKNLDGGSIRIGPTSYSKGLAMHSHTELEYDLKGEYRELSAFLGVEDAVGDGEGPTVVKIIGDGKELFSATVGKGQKLNPAAGKTKPAAGAKKENELVLPLKLSVVNVLKLRLVVASGDVLDRGKHATLAEAQVSK